MKESIKRIITGFVLSFIFWIAIFYAPNYLFSFLLLGILTTILYFEWPNFFSPYSPAFWLIMPFYPTLPFILLIYLNQHPDYHQLLLFLFVMVSSYDTGGYIIGSLMGKHKIAPKISPNKSLEGFWGGYLFSCISLSLLFYEFKRLQSWWIICGITGIVCIFACVGDLLESWLKRKANIKDSGNLLPGHGGFLDRFDGILAAVFFFYLFRDTLASLLIK